MAIRLKINLILNLLALALVPLAQRVLLSQETNCSVLCSPDTNGLQAADLTSASTNMYQSQDFTVPCDNGTCPPGTSCRSGICRLGESKPDVVDVRYSSGDTFILDDGQFDQIKAGLHYDSTNPALAKGGHAQTVLLDGSNRVLARITI